MSDVSSAKVYPGGVLVKGRETWMPPVARVEDLGFKRNYCLLAEGHFFHEPPQSSILVVWNLSLRTARHLHITLLSLTGWDFDSTAWDLRKDFRPLA